ncbi:uncharacterized protein PV07_08677 [Cladophialophora immunda]|uniref:Uncharacterized protein n=1 Tax=Cladophialophora immunda TaxID=569365 RepID=A0A0D1ZCS6_9EURO|nr:uncharacterized protein PV07_08677 [Cladophialophora immunda]KIW25511.1 hypothetical protein PV07_08677 [Cladophialophora immunda]
MSDIMISALRRSRQETWRTIPSRAGNWALASWPFGRPPVRAEDVSILAPCLRHRALQARASIWVRTRTERRRSVGVVAIIFFDEIDGAGGDNEVQRTMLELTTKLVQKHSLSDSSSFRPTSPYPNLRSLIDN